MLVLTFVLGGITGAVSFSLYHRHDADGRPHRDVVNDLAKSLSLDAAQREEIRKIMDRTRERYRALDQQTKREYEAARLQMKPQYEAIRLETRQEIRQVLHEDQIARFEEFLKDMDKQRRERESKQQ